MGGDGQRNQSRARQGLRSAGLSSQPSRVGTLDTPVSMINWPSAADVGSSQLGAVRGRSGEWDGHSKAVGIVAIGSSSAPAGKQWPQGTWHH